MFPALRQDLPMPNDALHVLLMKRFTENSLFPSGCSAWTYRLLEMESFPKYYVQVSKAARRTELRESKRQKRTGDRSVLDHIVRRQCHFLVLVQQERAKPNPKRGGQKRVRWDDRRKKQICNPTANPLHKGT